MTEQTADFVPAFAHIKISGDAGPWLAGSHCTNCDAKVVGERQVCPSCARRDTVKPIQLSSHGTLYNYTIVHRSYPGIKTPFIAAIVDLDGGGSLKGTLLDVEPTAAALPPDLPVEVVFRDTGHAITDFNMVTRNCVKAAYDRAGVGPEDVALIELHDCFATAEMVHYENLGLCGDGEAGRLIDTGYTALGGKVPVNVSGGLLSKGHPLGATGIANLYEVSLHLRGEAGARQVDGARIGLTHVVGGGPAWARRVSCMFWKKPNLRRNGDGLTVNLGGA